MITLRRLRRGLGSAALLLACGVPTGACVLPGMGEGGEGAAGGGGGAGGGEVEAASECEAAASSCEDCASCASKGDCAQLIAACGNDSACYAIDECLFICGGDPECAEQCYYQAPEGVELHNRAFACLYCDQCPSDCIGSANCG